MNTTTSQSPSLLRLALALVGTAFAGASLATTTLADQPVFTNAGVPGNLALALSVEFPTAHVGNTYSSANTYVGYFDANKCYLYSKHATDGTLDHFYPSGLASNRTCIGASNDSKWSGNFLNWATMQTIDPFRWALTGGYRSTDTTSLTLLEKAWASGQGGTGNFPNRSVSNATQIANATPFAWAAFNMRVQGLGNRLRFTRTADVSGTPTVYDPALHPDTVDGTVLYDLAVRVRVCDTSAGAGGVESNCTAYPNSGVEIYKPTGLLQQYAEKIRYSAFGYLNDSNLQRDGGVLRARQKFVGPTYQLPAASVTSNANKEWDADTGIITINPDPTDASDTATLFGVPVSNSGVLNYLNKFGQITPGGYKTYDPVGELYYAAIRYFKKLGNVPEWTATGSASTTTKTTWVDGFPVITNWDDPILYACQRNFVLGIGDVNTHADKNVPGATATNSEPTKPSAVTSDTSVDAVVATHKVGSLHGLGATLGSTSPYGGCCNNNSALMAGIAYDSNTKDIRPDVAGQANTKGKQTVQTYWLDILEYQTYKSNNQFYLAAKYGGFKVPDVFDPYARATDIPAEWWTTTGETVGSQARPDAYFVASNPVAMITGLQRAFADIVSRLRPYTTSFSTTLPQVSSTGVASYATRYDASDWTGEVVASSTTFDTTTGVPILTESWNFSTKLAAQIAVSGNTGWDTNRRIVTFRTDTKVGTPFRLANLAATQSAALDTVYRTGSDAGTYLDYLRGDKSLEEGQSGVGTAGPYRKRQGPIGDIVGSKSKPAGPPVATYANAANPGYSTFKTTWASRPTVVYVGSNSGMLHAVNGALTGTDAGKEIFAYVPGNLYTGPSGTPVSNGLVARGDPDFEHRYFVDGPAAVFDMDFGRTVGGTGTNWRSVLVGALGKGGKSYFAIDVTDPATMTTEAVVASRVLWEFSDTHLGYTFGEPTAVKTRKHGWVLVFASGYNNLDGQGYFYIVNPRTGELLKKIGTGSGSVASEAGLAHVQAYVLDRTDGTADAIYAGDLQGKLWRLDVTDANGDYPAPVQIAQLADANGVALPVTSRPLIVVQPGSNRRWITVGTGRLLNSADVGSSQAQGLFAIMDGTGLRPYSAAQLPSGMTHPVSNSNLRKLTDLTQRVTLNLATEIGWWYDIGSSAGRGWRVLSDPTSFYGVVAFPAMLPSPDVCNPSGTGRVYAIDLGTGQSAITNASGQPTSYFDPPNSGTVTDLRFYSVDGTPRLITCNDKGTCDVPPTSKPGGLGLRRLNWRELPLAD
jgi:type IV pilus assembly protein PilY1